MLTSTSIDDRARLAHHETFAPRPDAALDAERLGSECAECRLRSSCFPEICSRADLERFNALVMSRRRVPQGRALYRSGDACTAVYLIRSGFIKTLVLHENGREQVCGFHMSGEMLGLDGIATGKHASDAVALTDADVCVVPFDRLERLSQQAHTVQRYLYRLLSQEVVRKQSMMLLLGSMRAEQRVATFLLNLSQRFTAQGMSASQFILRMTRDEIGSLLGMKLETVSRIFSRLHKAGLIDIEGKHVRIVDIDGLRAMIGD